MAIIPFHIVDAFADQAFAGIPAAIIPNASNLDPERMFRIAEELAMEAGFVLPPTRPGADVRLRFQTPNGEVRFSGHVAVAAFASMCDRGFYRPTPGGVAVTLETAAGLLPVLLRCGDEGAARITVGLPAPRFGEPVPASEVAAALEVPPEFLWAGSREPQRVGCGFDQIVVPVADRGIFRGVDRRAPGIARLLDRRGAGGLTLVCTATRDAEVDLECRCFHTHPGHAEDIGSGTGAGAAAAYMVAAAGTDAGRTTLVCGQGRAVGRPNRVEVTVTAGPSGPEAVEITASGAVVMRGSFQVRPAVLAASGR
ncbi:PhzF family phenazine biosynthesis protein [bacterium]|nr:PhzF family phenazine biosynthesis protein [bacterium]